MFESKHQHTRGPWRTHIADSTMIVDAEGNEIASTLGDYDTEYEAMETRATFIAASPALYEALEIARVYVDEYVNANGGIDGCEHQDRVSLERVDAALTAARGETV